MAKTGKIIAIVPKLKDGTHENFVNKNTGKPLWVFVADIEGEGKGELFSSMTESKWKPGMHINFEVTSNDRAEGGKRFSKIEEVTVNGDKKGGYNDPINSKRMALSMSDSMAMLTVYNMEQRGFEVPYRTVSDIKTIGHKYYMWVTQDQTITDRDLLSRRWYAINFGVDAIKLKNIFTEVKGATDRVIEIAKEELEDVMKIQAPPEI